MSRAVETGRHPEGEPSGRFIPFRQADLVDLLEDAGRLPPDEDGFRELVCMLDATFHVEFRERLEALKDAYAPFARDPDTRGVRDYDEDERARAQQHLIEGVEQLLQDANFERIRMEEIHRAFEEESLLEVRVDIDLDAFEQVMVYRRGESQRTKKVSSWWGLRSQTISFTNYEKVLLFVTFQDAPYFHTRNLDIDALPFEPGATVVKLFQDVPQADIEMLFPNADVRMRRVDKLLIGVPAIISGVVVASTKLITTVGLLVLLLGFYLGFRDEPVELDQATLVTLGAGLGSFGGYLTRQFTKFKARKLQFVQTLSENLYFRNLDNDVGVFHNLLDAAEEEETKEAILGWYFLRAAEHPLTSETLDDHVEAWFREYLDCRLDFDVADGVEKLRRLGLARSDGGMLTAVPGQEALRRLDAYWDGIFSYDRS